MNIKIIANDKFSFPKKYVRLKRVLFLRGPKGRASVFSRLIDVEKDVECFRARDCLGNKHVCAYCPNRCA